MILSFTSLKALSPILFSLMLLGSPVAVLAQQPAPPATSVAQASGTHVQPSAVVNINTASAEELAAALSGIGLSKAQAIVAWRDANGAFTHPEQLLEVKGIGQATLDKNLSRISL